MTIASKAIAVLLLLTACGSEHVRDPDQGALPECCVICEPGKRACGNVCGSFDYCDNPPGCACNAEGVDAQSRSEAEEPDAGKPLCDAGAGRPFHPDAANGTCHF